MSLRQTLRSITPLGLRLPTGAGMLGPSGIGGLTFPKRIRWVLYLAERYARRYVDSSVAPEIAQTVAIDAWHGVVENQTFLDGTDPLPPIILGMVRVASFSGEREVTRRRGREAVFMEERAESIHAWMDPAVGLSEDDTEEVTRRALKRLTPAEREVLAMSREDGLTYAEIAALRGTGISTAKKQVARALTVYREECLKMGIVAPPPKEKPKRKPKAKPKRMSGPSSSPEGGADARS